MNFKSFIKECHEKEVFKNLSIYLVSSWVLIQVFSEIYEPFGLPKISMTYLLLVLLIGFPFYIYLLWRYRLKPQEAKLSRREGLKVSSKDAASNEETKGFKKRKVHLPGVHFYSPFQKMYFSSLLVISIIALFSASLIVKANFINQDDISAFTFPEEPDNDRIAVLPFENNTTDPNLDVVGNMAVDWIMHGITQNKVGQVISPQIVDDYTKVLKAAVMPSEENGVLKEFLKPSKVVTGTYYLNNDRLLLQCSVMDGNMNKTLVSFEVIECDANTPLDCIEAVKQRVLGYLDSKGVAQMALEETPPNFKAYKLWLESDELQKLQSDEQLKYINEAIAADSSFFKPKLDRVAYYYNRDEFAVADSLLRVLAAETGTKKEQLNMIRHYEACFKGDNRMAFKTYQEEYNTAPLEIEMNLSMMVLALQFVNKPQVVDTIYTAIRPDEFDLDNCISCEYRYFVQGMANLELNKIDETIEILKPYARTAGQEWIKEVLMKAYVLNGDHEAVFDLLEHIRLLGRIEYWQLMMLKTGLEYLKTGNKTEALKYFGKVSEYQAARGNLLSQSERELQAEIVFFTEDYPRAQALLESLLPDSNDRLHMLTYLAMAYVKNGEAEKAEKAIEQLNEMRTSYQFGEVDYSLARFYAFTGDNQNAYEHLLQAVAGGKRFTSTTFQNDYLFQPLRPSAAFEKILTFWHEE
jgi:TolB-like protein/Tfp pilus assembly protein PilF